MNEWMNVSRNEWMNVSRNELMENEWTDKRIIELLKEWMKQ